MKQFFSSATKCLPFHRPAISCSLLVIGAVLGLSTVARGQATTTFTPGQTTTTQATAITETFATAVAAGNTAGGAGTYTTNGDTLNGSMLWSGLGANSFTAANTQASSPLGSTTDKFLVVGNGTGQSSPVTMTFSNNNIHYFGLLWGSVDSTNTVTLNFLNNGVPAGSATYTATSIGLGGGSNDFVNFTTTSNGISIKSAVFTYPSVAFEIDNVTYGVVPEPTTGVCVVVLVGGAICLARRRSVRRLQA